MNARQVIDVLINEFEFTQSYIARGVKVTPTTINRYIKHNIVISKDLENRIVEFGNRFFQV